MPTDEPAGRDGSDDERRPYRTPVSEEYDVRLPPSVRAHLNLEPGDELRWRLTEDGDLTVEKSEGEWGAFEDFEPVNLGEVDAVEDHDLAGHEPALRE